MNSRPNGELHRTLGDSVTSNALNAGVVSASSGPEERVVFLISATIAPR